MPRRRAASARVGPADEDNDTTEVVPGDAGSPIRTSPNLLRFFVFHIVDNKRYLISRPFSTYPYLSYMVGTQWVLNRDIYHETHQFSDQEARIREGRQQG